MYSFNRDTCASYDSTPWKQGDLNIKTVHTSALAEESFYPFRYPKEDSITRSETPDNTFSFHAMLQKTRKDSSVTNKSDSTSLFYGDSSSTPTDFIREKGWTRENSPIRQSRASDILKATREVSISRDFTAFPETESLNAIYERRLQGAKNVLEQLNLVRERHIGLMTYISSLRTQLNQNVNIGIAEMRSKRNALVVELDSLLDESVNALMLSQREKERVLKEKEKEIEKQISELHSVVHMMELKIKAEPKARFVQHYHCTIKEAEEAMSINIPECDFSSDWAFVSLPNFNYVLVQSIKSELSKQSSMATLIDLKENKGESIMSPDRFNIDKKNIAISPIKVNESLDGTQLSSPITDISNKQCEANSSNKSFCSTHIEDEPESGELSKKYKQILEKHSSIKNNMIEDLMNAYKELECFYKISKKNPKIPKHLKSKLMNACKENIPPRPDSVKSNKNSTVQISTILPEVENSAQLSTEFSKEEEYVKLKVYIPQGSPPYSSFFSVKVTDRINTQKVIDRLRDHLKLPITGQYLITLKRSRDSVERPLLSHEKPGEILQSLTSRCESSWPRFYFKTLV
jgi:hypothetical protein